ncbi:esterase/lipase family protein [Rhodococcus tibetensis]|uniref:Triacylglycerol lipase n=1 Tax=Rhodococcus tibetensis TaxID=2965064 RepID=A0ABT1Q9A7_9NOCA|nr:triacylglycerol lipase [Rhodococcus sp. FXJ9.536]MCQ4118288.1 triacylglycerol lipase [Rhodococcus sp. FXJ9.536]
MPRVLLSRLLAAVGLAAAALLLVPSAPANAAGHDPILFVHGWQGSSSQWNTMIARLKADGWADAELYNWSYNSGQSNVTTAAQVEAKIDDILRITGAAKVDVVTHSMGGLSTRYYAKNLGGAARIDDWVSLAGPNHGTDTANSCFTASCTEMRIGSAYLTGLNSGDETPGTPAYGTWWSPCDTVINPDASVSLAGAANKQTGCLTHNGILEDVTVYGQVRDFVR